MRYILVTSHQKTEKNESSVGTYRAESIYQWTAGSRITTKNPPLSDGSNFLVQVRGVDRRLVGPALKNRRVGDADMYKGLLDRESLRAADGVKYFRDTLRHHCIKGAQRVFLWRFHPFNRARRGSVEMVKWIGKLTLLLKRLRDVWLDMLLMSAMSETQRQTQYLADVNQENEERRRN